MTVDERAIAFPFQLDRTGRLRVLSPQETVRQSVRLILATAVGERIMRPRYGSQIHEYVFEVLDVATIRALRSAVREALVENEPRLSQVEVTVSTAGLPQGQLEFRIVYQTHEGEVGETLHALRVPG